MKEYIEKRIAYHEEKAKRCNSTTEGLANIHRNIIAELKGILAAAIDLSGVTKFGMPALPDGLNDDSNVDYNFKVGWIACWKAFTQSGQQAPEPVEGWISVDKQLPPEHEKVIVQFGEQNVLMGIMDSNNKWCVFWSDGLNEMDNERPITHWRLSPQPIQP
jgi:hypothetical protein